MSIRLHVTSVFVDDQEHALRFYTEVLGFEPRTDVPLGNGDRWLTVASPGQDDRLPSGVEHLGRHVVAGDPMPGDGEDLRYAGAGPVVRRATTNAWDDCS